jgi:hypothetical protein
MAKKVKINRAPVMTLWAAVVAERLGYDREAALTIGKAVAGLNAQSKGRRLGIYEGPPEGEPSGAKRREQRAAPGETLSVSILGRSVPTSESEKGIRALEGDQPIDPRSVERYLEGKFGEDLADVRTAMTELAEAYDPDELSARAYELYEQFRPSVPEGQKGWGAKGELNLEKIPELARK